MDRSEAWGNLHPYEHGDMIDREIVLDAICGRTPPMAFVKGLQDGGCGQWFGGFSDEWVWKLAGLDLLTDKQLATLYCDLVAPPR